jgi:hypothetical protein
MNEPIEKLLADNKHRFEINKEVLDMRIKHKADTYNLIKPTLNLDQDQHSRVGKYYQNMHQLLIDSAHHLNSGYMLDVKLTKPIGSKFNVYYLKPEDLQTKEQAALKRKVKAIYIEELEFAKKTWIIEVTEQATKAVEVEAVVQAGIKAKELQASMLSMMS